MSATLAFAAPLPPARYDAMCRAIDAAQALSMLATSEHCPGFLLPECSGVYVFDYADGTTLYVGESRNLRRRLTTHERGFLRRTPGVRLRVVPCSNHKNVERWLIDELRPTLNGHHPWTGKMDRSLVARLRSEARSKLRHADALEAYGRSLPGVAA